MSIALTCLDDLDQSKTTCNTYNVRSDRGQCDFQAVHRQGELCSSSADCQSGYCKDDPNNIGLSLCCNQDTDECFHDPAEMLAYRCNDPDNVLYGGVLQQTDPNAFDLQFPVTCPVGLFGSDEGFMCTFDAVPGQGSGLLGGTQDGDAAARRRRRRRRRRRNQ